MKNKLLTIEEICAELGIGKNTAYKLVKNMKHVKIGRRILVSEKELEEYVDRLQNGNQTYTS
jgi:excisionase family DNA binding protein